MNKYDFITSKKAYREFCSTQGNDIQIFAQPWYLDAVCEDENDWQVILYYEENRLAAAFPFQYKKTKHGMWVIDNPWQAKRLGIWIDYGSLTKNSCCELLENRATEYIVSHLPSYDMFSIGFDSRYKNWRAFYEHGFQQTTYYSYIVNCCNGGDDYLSLISKQKRYEIRRSEKNRYIAQKEELSYDNYWDFFSYSYSLRNRTPDYSKEKMERLFNAACDNNSMCLYTLRNQEKIVATSILLFDTRRSFVMFNTFDPTNKQITGASLTYAGIVDVFSNGLIYDFEGSMISSVAQYYREFNGTPEPYFVITNYSRRYKMRKNIKECIRLIKPM